MQSLREAESCNVVGNLNAKKHGEKEEAFLKYHVQLIKELLAEVQAMC